MQKSEIQVDKNMSCGKERNQMPLFQRIKIIQHVRGKKWKANGLTLIPGWSNTLSPKPGGSLEGTKAFFRDEESERQLQVGK